MLEINTFSAVSNAVMILCIIKAKAQKISNINIVNASKVKILAVHGLA